MQKQFGAKRQDDVYGQGMCKIKTLLLWSTFDPYALICVPYGLTDISTPDMACSVARFNWRITDDL